MGELLLSWFLSKGVGILLGALGGFLRDTLNDKRNAQAQQDVGRLTTERDQARTGEEVQATLAETASKRVSDDDALSRLDKGDA